MATKKIMIDNKEVGFRASALTPRLYRIKMGRDIVRDMNQLRKAYEKAISAKGLKKPPDNAPEWRVREYEEAIKDAQLSVIDLQIFENAAYIMARQYDAAVPDTPDEWLDGFEMFSIYEVLPAILELWQINQNTTSVPKKK